MNTTITTDFHQTASTKFIEIKGTQYAYRDFGNNSGIPLLLLQHFTGTMDNWDPAITNGLAEYFHIFLFDNKGIGASTGDTPSTIKEMAADVISFINALGFRKVDILGFSMGGFIAQQIVLDAPRMVNKLILAGTGPKGSKDISGILKPLNESASMGPNNQKLFLFYEQTPTSFALGRESLTRINKRTIDRDTETSAAGIEAQLKSILDWAQPDADALNKLKEIKQPVLIVNGSNDIIVPTVNSYILFQNLPNGKLSLYPDSGHGSIFQYPDLFLGEAIPFLKAK